MFNEVFATERAGYPARAKQHQSKFLKYPRVVSIETQVSCNACCGFCPYPLSDRKGDSMDSALFHKILRDLGDIPRDHRFEITLARINEPLLDKRLRSFSEAIQEQLPNAHQTFWSNGTTITQKNIEWIKQIRNPSINISLNAVDPDSHSEYMGIALGPVINNLDRLHNRMRSGDYRGTVLLTALYRSEDESGTLVEYCNNRWPLFKVAVRPPFTWMGDYATGKALNERVNSTAANNAVLESPCSQWFDLHILASGFVTKCCIDEAGFKSNEYNVRDHHCLAIYAKARVLRETLPSRAEVQGCQGCSHMG